MVGVGAAQVERGGLARPAVGGHLHARLAGQQVEHGAGAGTLDLLAVDLVDTGQQLVGALELAGGGDHHGGLLGWRGGQQHGRVVGAGGVGGRKGGGHGKGGKAGADDHVMVSP